MSLWCVIVGLSLEISGAALIVWPVVLPLLIGEWKMIARRGALFPSGGPTADAARELAFTVLGLSLLIAGFALQLIGYLVGRRDEVLLFAAIGIVLVVTLGVWITIERRIAPAIHRRALATWKEMDRKS